MAELTEIDLKRAFAIELVKQPLNAFEIAMRLWPSDRDTHLAMQAFQRWPSDPDVLRFMNECHEKPDEYRLLPSKPQAAHLIYERAKACKDDETFGKLMRLYGDYVGDIEAAKTPLVQNAKKIVNKVIMMPAPLAKNDWSAQATAQQRALTIEGEKIAKNG